MAIEISGTLAVGRQRAFRMDPDGHGMAALEIRPAAARHEYITLVLGTVPRGERVTVEDVIAALETKLAQFRQFYAADLAPDGRDE